MLGGFLSKILPTALNVGKGLISSFGGPVLGTIANVIGDALNPTPANVNKEIPNTAGYVNKEIPTTVG